MNKIYPLSQAGHDLKAIVVPCFEDEAKNLRQLQSQLDIDLPTYPRDDFRGKQEEVLFLYPAESGTKIILVGLGEKAGFTTIKNALLTFRKKYTQRISGKTGILIPAGDSMNIQIGAAIANGWSLGAYDIRLYQTGLDKQAEIETIFLADQVTNQLNEEIAFGTMLADIQKSVLSLVNAPSNRKTPEQLASWAEQQTENNQVKCTILEKGQLEEKGMHALLAVNRGSEVPAKCIILEYTPDQYDKTIALVGKGVTFDTGGLSLKSRKNMHYMKSDMGGAAAVMGTFAMVAGMGLPIKLVAIVPATDNSVDALSVKPGDVIESYSGKTIEIIDTDAEGRLILADGIAYARKHYQPDHLIDVATLTGNVIQALGTQAAGLYANQDELAELILRSGEKSGEKVWRLPIWEAYGEEMRSDIADIKNLSDKPYAGSITAAKFLQFFTEDHPSWAHLDIAGMAFGPNPLSKGYSGTGFGIHLLYQTIVQLT